MDGIDRGSGQADGMRETAFGMRPPHVVRIALTGGPAGGKTSLIERAREVLPSLGYDVLVVNETATEQRENGIIPDDTFDYIDCQWFITEETIWKERLYERAAARRIRPVVVLTDRGVLDGKAFLDDDELFEEMLGTWGLDSRSAMEAYDAVIHLVTAADGAEEHYGNQDNPQRTEDLKGALWADRRCRIAWEGHPRHCIIDNDVADFAEKMRLATRMLVELVREASGEALRRIAN